MTFDRLASGVVMATSAVISRSGFGLGRARLSRRFSLSSSADIKEPSLCSSILETGLALNGCPRERPRDTLQYDEFPTPGEVRREALRLELVCSTPTT